MTKTKTIHIRTTEEIHAKASAKALEQRRSLTGYVEHLIDKDGNIKGRISEKSGFEQFLDLRLKTASNPEWHVAGTDELIKELGITNDQLNDEHVQKLLRYTKKESK